MDVKQPGRIERTGQISVIGFHLRIGRHVIERAKRRQADADFVLTDRGATALTTSMHEARAVLDRAAVFVGTPVRVGPDDLFDQIAVGAVKLDPSKPAAIGVLRRLDMLPSRP